MLLLALHYLYAPQERMRSTITVMADLILKYLAEQEPYYQGQHQVGNKVEEYLRQECPRVSVLPSPDQMLS